MQLRNTRILGTGKYLPKRKVTSEELGKQLGVDPKWIESHNGPRVRYFVEDETSSEMGAYAAQDALNAADLTLKDIDCIVCTSSIPEQAIPCTAALVQKHLGGQNSGIPAFDINSTCLGFLTALDTLSYLVEAGRFQRVLLVATEICERHLNFKDPATATLMGDGAAAAVIGKSTPDQDSKIYCARMETYSRGSSMVELKGLGNKYHPDEYAGNTKLLFRMNGPAIFLFTATVLPGFTNRLMEMSELDPYKDVKVLIPHQASRLALDAIRKRFGISEDMASERSISILEDHGNTVSASIPMALHEAIVQGKLQRGDNAILMGTSAGFSMAGLIFKY